MKRYIKYNGAPLNVGDIVDINNDGVPHIYEGEIGKTNYWPLCADSVDQLTRYDSCKAFYEGTGQPDKITRHDYPEKDYSTSSIPVTGYDKIYINPFEELIEGDVVVFNGRTFIKTGGQGTATHVLSAIPIKSTTSPGKIDLGTWTTAEQLTGAPLSAELPPGLGGGTGGDNTSNYTWNDSTTWNDNDTWQDNG